MKLWEIQGFHFINVSWNCSFSCVFMRYLHVPEVVPPVFTCTRGSTTSTTRWRAGKQEETWSGILRLFSRLGWWKGWSCNRSALWSKQPHNYNYTMLHNTAPYTCTNLEKEEITSTSLSSCLKPFWNWQTLSSIIFDFEKSSQYLLRNRHLFKTILTYWRVALDAILLNSKYLFQDQEDIKSWHPNPPIPSTL